MKKLNKLLALNLSLFDGAAAGTGAGIAAGEGATATGESANSTPSVAGKGTKRATNPLSTVQYGKQAEAKPAETAEGDTTNQAAADSKPTTKTTSDTLEAKKAEFEKLISGDYKDMFSERVQGIIDKRFKEMKTLQSQMEKLNPVIEMLSSKYGETDIEKLSKAIQDDDSYYEQEAAEKGLTVEQLKEFKRMERENAELKRSQEEIEKRQNADRIYAQWMQDSEQLKAQYPNFDLSTEIQNPDFLKLLRAGVPVKAAYQTVHMDDILSGAMHYTAQKTQEQVVNNIKARASRPTENGISTQTGVVVKSDVTKLSAADRREIARRAARGETITF